MKSKRNRVYIASMTFLFLFLFTVTGCTKTGREADLSVSESLANSNKWCVISVPYAAFKSEPSDAADVVNHGRRSDIYEIKGNKYITEQKETTIWYKFENGWLPESSVIVYDNQLKAQTAAGSMNE